MENSLFASENVTKFFLATCRRHRYTTYDYDATRGLVEYALIATECPVENNETEYIPLATGSSTELYIDPMLSCVGDMDIMFHCSSELAIPEGHRPPTELPAEFHRYVKVF